MRNQRKNDNLNRTTTANDHNHRANQTKLKTTMMKSHFIWLLLFEYYTENENKTMSDWDPLSNSYHYHFCSLCVSLMWILGHSLSTVQMLILVCFAFSLLIFKYVCYTHTHTKEKTKRSLELKRKRERGGGNKIYKSIDNKTHVESLYDIGSSIALPIRKFERNVKENKNEKNSESKKRGKFYCENDFNENVKVSLAFERFVIKAFPK